jgi:hypothetical protein
MDKITHVITDKENNKKFNIFKIEEHDGTIGIVEIICIVLLFILLRY